MQALARSGSMLLAPCAGMAAWLAGSGWQLQQAALLAASQRATLAALGAGLLLAAIGLRRRAAAALLAFGAAAALLGFAATDGRAALRLAQALDPALEGQDLVVTGHIDSLPRRSALGQRFEFVVESAEWQGRAVTLPPRLSLGWFHGFDGEMLLAGPPLAIVAGDRWRLPVRLKQPHGVFNPQGFDLEAWMFERGLRASGSVRPGAQRLTAASGGDGGFGAWHRAPVPRARQWVRDAITLRVGDVAAAGVLAALAVGDQAAIERDDWELFRITGVAHLMSISGLHVTMFGWLAAAVVGALWRVSPRAMLRLPAPTAARIGALAGACGYALLAGFGVPAQRTVLMVAVVVGLQLTGRRWPAPWALLAAAFGVALWDPWALNQPGFWLSFGAVALLMADGDAFEAARSPGARLRAACRTQTIATIGLAPLTLVFFQQVSLVGFAANLLAIPLVTLLITPLALAGVLLPPLWSLGAGLVAALQWALQGLAAVPAWSAAAAPAWAATAGLLGGALLVLPLPWRLRGLGLPLLLPLLWPPVERPPAGAFELLAADVGQGTAVLVRTRHHLLAYDTGPAWSAEADAGGRVLLPLLRARGEMQIDRLILSHRDSDHVGGAASLLAGIRVIDSASSLETGHALLERLRRHRRCEAGQAWAWDGVRFEILHPPALSYEAPAKPNASSCVLKVTDALGRSALLTGDIEAAQEAALVERAGAALQSDLLLVPHHGSRTSSSPAFLAAVRPQIAVTQAAYRSRFGHPAPAVLARYRAQGIGVVRSDRCGAFHWKPGEGDQRGVCERERRRRYWHHPAGAEPVPR